MTVSSAPERAVPGGVRTQAGAPADARASKQKGVQASRRRAAEGRSTLHDKFIAGVPARIMRPRLVFIACLAAIVCFGVLMVYSASAVEALSERGDPTFFLTRQFGFVAVGVILAVCVAYGKRGGPAPRGVRVQVGGRCASLDSLGQLHVAAIRVRQAAHHHLGRTLAQRLFR